jgi:hypothetical protein
MIEESNPVNTLPFIGCRRTGRCDFLCADVQFLRDGGWRAGDAGLQCTLSVVLPCLCMPCKLV